jgi:G:T/U-mismatch repair DNA glycosylase
MWQGFEKGPAGRLSKRLDPSTAAAIALPSPPSRHQTTVKLVRRHGLSTAWRFA